MKPPFAVGQVSLTVNVTDQYESRRPPRRFFGAGRTLFAIGLLALQPITLRAAREHISAATTVKYCQLVENTRAYDQKAAAENLNAPQGNYLYDVYFIDEYRGWILGAENEQSFLLQSIDGGQNWQEGYRTPDGLSKIRFANERVGWMVGGRGTILRTSDGGISWDRQRSGTTVRLAGLAVIDASNAWAAGASGTLLHTRDGGETWAKQNINSSVGISDIAFVDAENGWAVGYGTIFSTGDGGKTWEVRSSGEWKPLASVFFADRNLGWIAVGPVVLRTTDGGKTWREASPPSQGQATSLSFVDSQHGWVVKSRGEEGSTVHIPGYDKLSSESSILATMDGGATWQNVLHIGSESDHSAWVLDMFFVNRTKGWAVGRNGLVLRTVNSGKNWQRTQLELSAMIVKKPRLFVGRVHNQQKTVMTFPSAQVGGASEPTQTGSLGRTVDTASAMKIETPGCLYWHSRVDETLTSPYQQVVDYADPTNILEAIGCLLQMEGNKHRARFSGATSPFVSQLFDPAPADVAALYYISYLYYQKWDHASAVALRDETARLTQATLFTARTWATGNGSKK